MHVLHVADIQLQNFYIVYNCLIYINMISQQLTLLNMSNLQT